MAQGVLSVLLTDLSFNILPGQAAPIVANVDGDIVLTTVDNFPAHQMTLLASDMYAVKAIDPNILPCGCIITEQGLGEVARGYIFDPAGQINDNGHTITLSIPNQTEGLRMDTTGPGYVAAVGLDTLAHRLASRSPPWTAAVIDTGTPVVSVQPVTWYANDPTVSNANLNTFTKDAFVQTTYVLNGVTYTQDSGVAVADGWNVGALTHEHFDSGDGAITSLAFGATTYRMFGFTNNFFTYDFSVLNHAIYLSTDGQNKSTSGILAVYESGIPKWSGVSGSYFPGDILSVEVVNGQVQYKRNGTVFYISSVPPAYPCYGACSLHTRNASILGATMTTYVAPKDTYYAVAFENATVLDALMQLAARTFRHIRQKQVNGVPQQALELGLMNAPPTMTLKTSDGESPVQVQQRNPNIRLFSPQVDYQWTTSQVITIGAAQGGGSGDTQVDLVDLYNYINTPQLAPTPRNGPGLPYLPLFPEYDATNFPIERRVALNGTYYYVVKNTAAIATMKQRGHWSGEIWGDVSNSSIVYVDQSPDAQRMAVQRTLYVDVITKLKNHAVSHFTATIQTEGRGRITPAGDLINVQIKRQGRGRVVGGAQQSFMETNINATPMVMEVIRKYRENDIIDNWKVSTLGRLLTDDSTILTNSLKQMEAIRLIPDTTESDLYIGPIEQTINSIYPLDIPIDLPNTMYRMTAVTIRVTAKAARHNVRLTQGALLDGAHQHTTVIPPLTVQTFNINPHYHMTFTPTHEHGGINGNLGTSGATGIGHGHDYNNGSHTHVIHGTNPYITDGASGDIALKFTTATVSGTKVVTSVSFKDFLNQQSPGHTHGEDAPAWSANPTVTALGLTNRSLDSGLTGINFATSYFLHDTSGNISSTDGTGPAYSGITTQQSLPTATDDPGHAGVHTHSLFPEITETNLGSYFQIWIDSGDGVYVDRSPELGGPWISRDAFIKGNVTVSGTGAERFFQAPGRKVGIRVIAINTNGNPTGIQNVQVVALMTYEKTAYAQTIFAA